MFARKLFHHTRPKAKNNEKKLKQKIGQHKKQSQSVAMMRNVHGVPCIIRLGCRTVLTAIADLLNG